MKQLQLQLKTTSPAETEAVAAAIGKKLAGHETIELMSDLGGGKTTFVRGLAHGFGSSDTVSSPTFTISKVYEANGRSMYHFDFYRLHEPGIIADELAEVSGDPGAVTVVEWADAVKHVLPKQRLTIRIEQTPEGNRQLLMSYPQELAYLTEGL